MYKLFGLLTNEQKILEELNSSRVTEAIPKNSNTLNSVLELLGLVLLLIIILVAAYFTTRIFGNAKKNQLSNHNFTFIESYPVGQGKTLQLVRIGTKYVVISVTKDCITSIAELSEEEVTLLDEDNTNKKTSFQDILTRFKKCGNETSNSDINKNKDKDE